MMILILPACDSAVSNKAVWKKPETIMISCENYHAEIVESGILYNNVWNKNAAKLFPWKQCLEKDAEKEIYGWSWSWPEESRSIFAYPQIKLGKSPWAPEVSVDSRFPVSNGELQHFRVKHELEVHGDGEHNVATSLWLTHTAEIGNLQNSSVIVAELMIWTYQTPHHFNPAGQKISEVDIDGQTWEVWVDKNWGDVSGAHKNKWIYITFRATQNSLNAEFDLVKLTNYATANGFLPHHFFYSDIELGNEIMSGKGLTWVKEFSIDLQ